MTSPVLVCTPRTSVGAQPNGCRASSRVCRRLLPHTHPEREKPRDRDTTGPRAARLLRAVAWGSVPIVGYGLVHRCPGRVQLHGSFSVTGPQGIRSRRICDPPSAQRPGGSQIRLERGEGPSRLERGESAFRLERGQNPSRRERGQNPFADSSTDSAPADRGLTRYQHVERGNSAGAYPAVALQAAQVVCLRVLGIWTRPTAAFLPVAGPRLRGAYPSPSGDQSR